MPAWLSLCPGERQAVALDRIGEDTGRPVVLDAVEGLQQGFQVVAAQVGHQPMQRRVVVHRQQVAHRRVVPMRFQDVGAPAAQLFLAAFAPGDRAALVGERRVERIGALVDPVAQLAAAGLLERRLQQRAVFDRDDAPAEGLKQVIEMAVVEIRDRAVQALAVVVDDPPDIADVVFPAFQQAFVDVALVELGVAGDRHHAAARLPFRQQLMDAQVVLHERGEAGHRDTEANGAGGEIHVVLVLGARGIGLRAAEGAELLELVLRLVAEQILNGVERRARVRLDGDPVLRAQDVEIERREYGGDGCGGCLVAAHLQAVTGLADIVGVVDHPGGQPQDLALQLPDEWQRVVRPCQPGLLFCLMCLTHPRSPARFRWADSIRRQTESIAVGSARPGWSCGQLRRRRPRSACPG